MERSTGKVVFAVGGLDLAIMSVCGHFVDPWHKNFIFCITSRIQNNPDKALKRVSIHVVSA